MNRLIHWWVTLWAVQPMDLPTIWECVIYRHLYPQEQEGAWICVQASVCTHHTGPARPPRTVRCTARDGQSCRVHDGTRHCSPFSRCRTSEVPHYAPVAVLLILVHHAAHMLQCCQLYRWPLCDTRKFISFGRVQAGFIKEWSCDLTDRDKWKKEIKYLPEYARTSWIISNPNIEATFINNSDMKFSLPSYHIFIF